ncbi:hypothetical protein ANANG_G00051750 [Anguilla anguilla]|uniref:Arsenite methyltransferase n=1 Tax=Anguilla anguilla TaxID=7936 RepID=A0A9D3S5N7_ANGAN|nr:hypothetical protein ANANG_G00051750 [Anguilla anguilla]
MTEEQLVVARKYIEHHTQKFGFSEPNVDFIQGYIEGLEEAGLKENSFDIIISNCVVNLSPDKPRVLREAFRALKATGLNLTLCFRTEESCTSAIFTAAPGSPRTSRLTKSCGVSV